jgi:peptide/nickel transport system substrate-binding protein
VDALADKILQEADPTKRDLLIKNAFEILNKDFGYIPLHQQALAWGVSKKLKVVQRPDNQVLPYWMTKRDE